MTGDFLDDLFHGCAIVAFVEVRRETNQFPPDGEAVRRRTYRYYEEKLARTEGLEPCHPPVTG
jgi:hypothetical protein